MHRFELPFEHTVTYRQGIQYLSFQSAYTMEQMREEIENVGYVATIYDGRESDNFFCRR